MTGESDPRLAPVHRVLVVEDDGLIALSIAELLIDLGAAGRIMADLAKVVTPG